MKLLFAAGSPFARKAWAVIGHLKLDNKVETVTVAHREPTGGLWEHNPFAKIPTLLCDDGSAIIESMLIAEYLDTLHDGPKLFPPAGPARVKALQLAAYGDEITEAGVKLSQEKGRPEDKIWPVEADRLRGKIARGLAKLEAEPDRFAGPTTIGHISLGCAISFVDRRMPEIEWRQTCPKLAAWFDRFYQSDAMQKSLPPPGPKPA